MSSGLACTAYVANLVVAPLWHCEHVAARFARFTDDLGSDAGRMSCAVWQSEQDATPMKPRSLMRP